jgi:hypothetical protein
VTGNPWTRPYVLTGGRTRTEHQLYMHTLVSVGRYDPAAARRLAPESRQLYERAAQEAQSVAELSAHCGVSLGVTQVLLEDLADTGRVQISENSYQGRNDLGLLQRVVDGLRQLA